MATAQDTIVNALRELNVVPVGTTAATLATQTVGAAQLTEGLARLNGLQRIIFGGILGELLQDWEAPFQQRTAPVAANFPQNPYPMNQDALFMGMPLSGGAGTMFWPYPPKNSRVIFGGTQNTTVWFPEQPSDGSFMAVIQGALANVPGTILTLDGNSRTINGSPTLALTTPITTGQVWIYRADLGDWRPIADLALTDQLPYVEDVNDFITLSLAIRIAPANDKTVSAETAQAYKDARAIFQARYRQEGTTVYKSADIPSGYESFQSGHYWW